MQGGGEGSTVGAQKRRWRGGVSRGTLGALDGSDMPEHAQGPPASPLGIRTPTLLYKLSCLSLPAATGISQ